MLSSGLTTPAAPPSAETVWLRIGYTLEMTAMRSFGLTSAAAMAARSPAPPPPIRRTSCDEASMALPKSGNARRAAFDRAQVRHILPRTRPPKQMEFAADVSAEPHVAGSGLAG